MMEAFDMRTGLQFDRQELTRLRNERSSIGFIALDDFQNTHPAFGGLAPSSWAMAAAR